MPKNPWKTHSSKYVLRNKWFSVRTDAVTTPGGQPGEYNVIEIAPPVAVVALNAKNEICLIRQFRYPRQLWLWEVPMGAIDEKEKPLTAAKRELREETGLTSDEWQAVGINYGIKGVTTQIVHTFLARNVRAGNSAHDGTEAIDDMRFISFKDFYEEVRRGSITDAEAITAVSQVAAHLHLI